MATTLWDRNVKPTANICPGGYCFHFLPLRSKVASGLHDSLDEGMGKLELVMENRCGWSNGLCTRLDPVNGDKDWYEPHELNLEADGLPWFFFTPHPLNLTEEFQGKYIEESEIVWGKDHWIS